MSSENGSIFQSKHISMIKAHNEETISIPHISVKFI